MKFALAVTSLFGLIILLVAGVFALKKESLISNICHFYFFIYFSIINAG